MTGLQGSQSSPATGQPNGLAPGHPGAVGSWVFRAGQEAGGSCARKRSFTFLCPGVWLLGFPGGREGSHREGRAWEFTVPREPHASGNLDVI